MKIKGKYFLYAGGAIAALYFLSRRKSAATAGGPLTHTATIMTAPPPSMSASGGLKPVHDLSLSGYVRVR